MRIPVAGASRYLGRKVAEYLATGGNDIAVLVKSRKILNNRVQLGKEVDSHTPCIQRELPLS